MSISPAYADLLPLTEDQPLAVEYDPTWNTNPDGIGMNKGCPVGYFAQLVPGALGVFGAGYDVRCRRMDAAIMQHAATILPQESGEGMVDQTMENLAAASSAVAGAVLPGLGVGVLLLVGMVALVLVAKR